MNVLSQPFVLPSNNPHRIITTPRSQMFLNAPVAVSNKIKAIQARKARLTLVSTDAVYTEIRPLNFGYNNNVTNSGTDFTVLTAERLVDRSKDFRLDRISARQPSRPSIILNTNNNQQSLLWSNYPSSTRCNKQHQAQSTTRTPPALGSSRNKSPNRKMPEIRPRQNRLSLVEQHNSPMSNETKEKTKTKPQPSQNIMIQSHDTTLDNNNNLDRLETEEEEDDENLPIDEEFEQYLEKAIIKCADWLIKYVFI